MLEFLLYLIKNINLVCLHVIIQWLNESCDWLQFWLSIDGLLSWILDLPTIALREEWIPLFVFSDV